MTDAPDPLDDFRCRKDAHFASGRGPIRGEALEAFAGLKYYPPDPALVFRLPLERGDGAEITLQTSSGEPRQMQEFGSVLVPFGDGEATLTLYAPPGEEAPGSLFLPFRDAGSGSESYGAGRYLDAPTFEREDGLWVSLDFNLAYHPYCAYGDGWTCPLPPSGNWLNQVVRAGERLP
ncbi:DUF1684 domain-containing protein [Deinococcus altitudinis]|uniref:DUF1684 domain-containing protein n=1 Tax=Deinococcus altitudinis TaxID=468914 RepID=UPI003891FF12